MQAHLAPSHAPPARPRTSRVLATMTAMAPQASSGRWLNRNTGLSTRPVEETKRARKNWATGSASKRKRTRTYG